MEKPKDFLIDTYVCKCSRKIKTYWYCGKVNKTALNKFKKKKEWLNKAIKYMERKLNKPKTDE